MLTRTNSRLAALTAIIALACSSLTIAQDEKIELKLNLKQGQTFKLRLTTANSGAASTSTQTVNTTETLKMGLAFSVESVEQDSTARLRVTFDNPNYTVTTAGQPGAEQVLNPIGKAFAALHDRSFTIEVTSTGEVRSLTGLDNATSGALQSLAGQPEAVRQIAGMMFAQTMSEPMWKHAMSSIFSVIPDHPVAINERWSKQFAVSSPAGGSQGVIYSKITERGGGVCKLKTYHDLKSMERAVGPSVKLAMSGTSEGTAEIEEATGLMIRAYSTTSLKGKAVESGKSGSAPLTARSTTSVERYQ